MKPFNYTPTPWEIETDHDGEENTVLIHGQADTPGLVQVALVYTAAAFGEPEDNYEGLPAECDGNAQIIKHAADMYELLKAVNTLVPSTEIYGAIKTLLAKIEKEVK